MSTTKMKLISCDNLGVIKDVPTKYLNKEVDVIFLTMHRGYSVHKILNDPSVSDMFVLTRNLKKLTKQSNLSLFFKKYAPIS